LVLAAGTRFGSYGIPSVLETGGADDVYRARDTPLGRDVAVKALVPDAAGDPQRLARLGPS
jgi:serine/threonine protein kinase